jgi:DNA-directed RNA polymerase specialized sigma24 family protein
MAPEHPTPKPGVFVLDTKRQKAFLDAVTLRDEFVRGYFFSRTRNEDLSKDLAQQTWIAVYRSFRDEDFTNLGLLKRKAFQVLVGHWRASQTRSFVKYTDNIEDLAPVYIAREEEGTEAEDAFEVRFWANFLPVVFDPLDRKLFMLKERYGYTGEEIAAKVELPVSTIHHRIEALKRAAKERLEKNI